MVSYRDFLQKPKPIPRYVLTNLSFCYPENLFIIFGLFQYDELCYYPESIFKRKKKKYSVHGKCPNFSMLLRLSEFQVKNSGSLRLGHWKPIFQFFSQIRQGKTPRSRMRIHRKLQYWLEDFFLSRKGWQEPTYSVLNNNWGGLHFKM